MLCPCWRSQTLSQSVVFWKIWISSSSMARYREHILSNLGWGAVSFSGIPPIGEETHRDKAWRFITLIFMQTDREIELSQEGENIWVQRADHEAYA